jgi:HD-GYP domain-containing protein (c-di-GMP phosphodiesterase class II)
MQPTADNRPSGDTGTFDQQVQSLIDQVNTLETQRDDVVRANINYLRELAQLNRVADMLTQHRSYKQVMGDLLQEVKSLTHAQRIWLIEPNSKGDIRDIYSLDQTQPTYESLPLEVQDLTQRVLEVLPDQPLVMPHYDPTKGDEHFVAMSMCSDHYVMGVLCYCLPENTNAVDSQQIRLVSSLLHHTTLACENVRLLETLSNMIVDVVVAMALAIESRDPYTGGHVERVTAYSILLAKHAGLDRSALATLRIGGLLHDIGKIAVPDAILRKPLPLTKEEFEQMKPHPVVGHQIISPIPQLAKAAPIVRWHHERIDGKGYPDGLAGDAIPLLSRVAAIADTYDAMTSDRPYRRGLDMNVAREEIHRCAGTQFDPALAEIFLSIPEDELLHTVANASRVRDAKRRVDSVSLLETLDLDFPVNANGGDR